jgi:hypothetical protein
LFYPTGICLLEQQTHRLVAVIPPRIAQEYSAANRFFLNPRNSICITSANANLHAELILADERETQNGLSSFEF